MFKRLAVLFVLVGVSIAAAATLKMKAFYFTTGDDQDGVATLHYVPGLAVTKIHVTITGFAPNTSYGVCLDNGAVDSGVANGIRTNEGGNGEVNLSNPGDITGTPRTVKIYIDTTIDPNDPGYGYYNVGEEIAAGTAQ
jgi:hypothetical protein